MYLLTFLAVTFRHMNAIGRLFLDREGWAPGFLTNRDCVDTDAYVFLLTQAIGERLSEDQDKSFCRAEAGKLHVGEHMSRSFADFISHDYIEHE